MRKYLFLFVCVLLLSGCSLPFLNKEKEEEVPVETFTLSAEYSVPVYMGDSLDKENVEVYLKSDLSGESTKVEDYTIDGWSNKTILKNETFEVKYEDYSCNLSVQVEQPEYAKLVNAFPIYEGREDEIKENTEVYVYFSDGHKKETEAIIQSLYVNSLGKEVELKIKAGTFGNFDIKVPYYEVAGVEVILKEPIKLSETPAIDKINLKYWDNSIKDVTKDNIVSLTFPEELVIGKNNLSATVYNKMFLVSFYIEEILEDPEPEQVSGDSVTWIGDSYSVGAESEIKSRLPGVDLRAKVSKHFEMDAGEDVGGLSGISILKEIVNNEELRPILVFALGTNDPISDSSLFLTYIDRVMELAGNSTVVFVTPKTLDGGNYSGVVSAMNNSREKYPNVRVANWDKLVEESSENYFAGDNVHLTSSGYSAWVDIICRQFM